MNTLENPLEYIEIIQEKIALAEFDLKNKDYDSALSCAQECYKNLIDFQKKINPRDSNYALSFALQGKSHNIAIHCALEKVVNVGVIK